MSTLAINPTETEITLPYDLANVPDGYFDRAANPERLRDLKTGARDMFSIPPSMIVVEEGHNPRNYNLSENRAHLDELKRSIAEHGVLQPLWVRFDVPAPGEKKAAILVDGECRLRAVQELIAEGTEIRSVPVIQVEGKSQTQRILDALTSNMGKPLSKWELGEAFRRLIRFGWDESAVAKKTGYTARFVTEAVELADAPEEIKELLSSQAVTPSLALATLRTEGSNSVAVLKQRVEVAKRNGQTTVKRTKAPSAAKEESKNVSNLVLYAAEEMAKALDRWTEDATPAAETAVIEAHKAYRKLIRAPKQGEAA
jgi:ParB family transcriptional regulator, chromosome partitioning protein